MKKVMLTVWVAMAGLFAAGEASADKYVRGHYRSNGTYVQPYQRSNADGNVNNNYSTHPNVNPYTGKVGTHHYPTFQNYSNPSSGNYNLPTYGNNYGGR
jgi:hypothetical protein